MVNFSKKIFGKRSMFIISALFYLIGIVLYFFYDFNKSKQNVILNIDTKLRAGALGISYILGDDFHDRISDEKSISREEYINFVKVLSKYAEDEGLKYVYTMIKHEDKIVFTSTSATREEMANGEYSNFFEEYTDSTQELKDSFNLKKEFFEEASDKWGNFRSILVPRYSTDGNLYLAGADITIKDIDEIFRQSLMKSLKISLYFLVIILPLIFVYYLYMKREEEEFINNLYKDRLTGFPNREKLLYDIRQMENPVIMLVNINSFKEINDFYGHKIGDTVLIEMANRLKSIKTKDKFELYKMTADEYALLFSRSISHTELEALARYFFESISEEPIVCDDEEINLTVTLGAAQLEGEEKNKTENELQRIVLCADMALKKAKEIKRHFLVFDESMQISQEYENNVKWRKKLLDAIKNDRIQAYFQPIINNKNEKIEKFETLIRLIDIDGKVISPYQFLEVSKKARVYHYLTRIVINKAFERFEESEMEFSINLSVDDILDELTASFIVYRLAGYKNPNRVVFEILESDGIENYEKVSEFIKTVKHIGAKIAIDDFGSGYANFMHIMKLDVDYIKIDASMIKNIDKDLYSQVITSTIVEFAKKLNIKTIAEYVHSEAVYKKTLEMGVDYSQGYYFGEPQEIPAEKKLNETKKKEGA